MQQNPEVYNKTNTTEDYAPPATVAYVAAEPELGLPHRRPSIPRNNPVFNISNTLTWLKGRHMDLRRHLRVNRAWTSPVGASPSSRLGTRAIQCPASSMRTTMPGCARPTRERPGASCAADRTSEPNRRSQHR